jgi:hypothetical protein
MDASSSDGWFLVWLRFVFDQTGLRERLGRLLLFLDRRRWRWWGLHRLVVDVTLNAHEELSGAILDEAAHRQTACEAEGFDQVVAGRS